MKALLVCEDLIKAIKEKEIVEGYIHSVFKNACNIETENNFITLLSEDKNIAPMSLVVGNGDVIDFKELEITKECRFRFDVNGIYCREKELFIDLKKAEVWFSGVEIKKSFCAESKLINNIKTLEQGLYNYSNINGIAPLIGLIGEGFKDLHMFDFKINCSSNHYEFVKYRFIRFIDYILKGQIEKIAESSENIFGFGPGLTPAMDDFISGFMISFVYLSHYYKINMTKILTFNKEIISRALRKTTKVSYEMLKHSSRGEANRAVKELMEAVIFDFPYEDIIKTLMNTIGFGETSGSDTAFGIYVACKVMSNLKYREVWSNELMC